MNELDQAKRQYESVKIPKEYSLMIEETIKKNPKSLPHVVEIPSGSTSREVRAISGVKFDWSGFQKFSLGFVSAAVLCMGIFGITLVNGGIVELKTPSHDEKIVVPVNLSDGDSKTTQTLSQPQETSEEESEQEKTSINELYNLNK